MHLLRHKALAEVNPHKGKFRSFLLASIKNYLSKEADRARCSKRGGNVEFVPLDTENAEEICQFEPADFLTAETIFDARWATALLQETMTRLGNQYAAQGKSATLQALEPFLAPGGVVRTGSRSASGQHRRGQDTYPPDAKAVYYPFT